MNFKKAKLFFLICLEYLKRNKNLIGISVLIFFGLIFAQLKLNLFHNPNVVRLGFIGTYQEHDLPQEVIKLVSDGLIRVDENNRSVANLVTGWDTNNEATEFKFKLKDDLKWSDGSKISAYDLEFPVPNTEVTYPDDKTIQFKLKESYSPLPSLLTRPLFKKGTLLGIGPYEITKVERSRIFITKLTLKSKEPSLPEIQVRFYPSEKVALDGFNIGEVQALFGLSNVKNFSSDQIIKVKQKTDYSKIVTILYQTEGTVLESRSLRQALSYASPKIVGEEEANNPYPSFSWAYNKDAKKYLENKSESEEALKRASSSVSKDQLKGELILTSTPNLEEVAKSISTNWKDLGLNVKLRIESGVPQNFQALLITQSIPSDPDQYFLWHATQEKTNLTKYKSERVDKDLEDGRKIVKEEERKTKYFDFQRALLEDAPATFLYFPKYNIVYLQKIEKLLDKVLAI